jgi:hypothetical protein
VKAAIQNAGLCVLAALMIAAGPILSALGLLKG